MDWRSSRLGHGLAPPYQRLEGLHQLLTQGPGLRVGQPQRLERYATGHRQPEARLLGIAKALGQPGQAVGRGGNRQVPMLAARANGRQQSGGNIRKQQEQGPLTRFLQALQQSFIG